MNRSKKYLYFCSVCFCCLLAALLADPLTKLLTSREFVSLVLLLETGQTLAEPAPTEQTATPTEPTQTTTAPEEIPPLPQFSAQDAALVQVNSYCGYAPAVETWLAQPLSWNLQQPEPTVLILHSHATESYVNQGEYQETTPYRTLDTNYNMVSIGDVLGFWLESAGIGVVHDKSLHDSPSYSDAYENSRASAQTYLQQHPSIRLILDLHRDSVEDADGNQVRYTLQTPEGTAAKLMLVVGTDAGGLTHSKWPENMALAVKLQALLEKENPGICRPISFRTQRFNQDLSTGALLLEMGSAGNTREEVLRSTKLLADAIITLAKGTE